MATMQAPRWYRIQAGSNICPASLLVLIHSADGTKGPLSLFITSASCLSVWDLTFRKNFCQTKDFSLKASIPYHSKKLASPSFNQRWFHLNGRGDINQLKVSLRTKHKVIKKYPYQAQVTRFPVHWWAWFSTEFFDEFDQRSKYVWLDHWWNFQHFNLIYSIILLDAISAMTKIGCTYAIFIKDTPTPWPKI